MIGIVVLCFKMSPLEYENEDVTDFTGNGVFFGLFKTLDDAKNWITEFIEEEGFDSNGIVSESDYIYLPNECSGFSFIQVEKYSDEL